MTNNVHEFIYRIGTREESHFEYCLKPMNGIGDLSLRPIQRSQQKQGQAFCASLLNCSFKSENVEIRTQREW